MLDVHMTKSPYESSQSKESVDRFMRSAMDQSNVAAIRFWADHVARDQPPIPVGTTPGPTTNLGCR